MSDALQTTESDLTTTGDETSLSPDLKQLMEEALSYHDGSLSESTRRAYRTAWKSFTRFCQQHDVPPMPATETVVALYLTKQARRLRASTLGQHLSAIGHYHKQRNKENPARSEAVRRVMKGIRRAENEGPRQAKPLLTPHIKKMVDSLPGSDERPEQSQPEMRWLFGLRNRALLLLGFAGALRRSELAALRKKDLGRRPQGLLITIPESKTDQEGEGQSVSIRRIEESRYCPVQALRRWTEASGIEEGPLFRGTRQDGSLRPGPISGRTVANVVTNAAERAGLSDLESISAHSLRAGHITQVVEEGVPISIIQEQSRHESTEAFQEYVRPQSSFATSPSGQLGL